MADVYPRHDSALGVPANPSFPKLEEQTLEYWAADGTFQASVDQRAGAPEYVFYDGPPFANGLPHYGHLLTGYVKDLVPRYQTMRGNQVERRFGWDTHGLPAEVEAEKQLGIKTKAEVLELGLKTFNEACRSSVLRYTSEWERYVTRQARWVDFDNDYKTLDLSYMESVMWAFKQLHEKGLIYEGFRVLPYCWRCETPLSNTETRMDDVYRDRQDPAITVGFRLVAPGTEFDGVKALAWTTTPWTLPSNLGLAVGVDIEYAVVAAAEERYLIGASRLAAYEKELGEGTVVATYRGRDLAGLKYQPLFDFLADTPNAFQIMVGEFVSDEDGTGIVQMAPAFGEDDQNLCLAYDIPTVVTVDDHTRFTALVPPYQGMQVFEANKPVTAALKADGAVLRHESYVHSYPHCWRCDTPLVYKAVSSWFVEVTKFKDRMVELNQEIRWEPGHVKDGSFGKWLANARDWSISRNRFWGSPIPVWKSDDPNYPRVDVYGSLNDLERDFGVHPTDLHRPEIDSLTRPNPDDPTGKSTMRRVPEVLDCWFESGAMPFAQVHYPFENKEWFDSHYPGDFIVEYIGQTRGWFYTLHVLATALFDRPAFRNCVSHGIVLGNDGRKMSKSLGNYPDVYEMFESYGSDAMRWFLMSSPILRGGDLIVTEEGIRDAVRQVINPLWNSWYFFSLYANAESHQVADREYSAHVLDRYALSKLRQLVVDATQRLDNYDIAGACAEVRDFLDALTNWYIRRSRDRFWAGDTDAFHTLAVVLETLARITAPLAPMISEEIWRGLTGARSVHLADWPDSGQLPHDAALVAAMDATRQVCSAALSLRKAKKLRVRLPLSTLTVASPDAHMLQPYLDLIRDEVNVKKVVLSTDVDAACSKVLTIVPRVAGPRLGGAVQQVIRAVKAGNWRNDNGVITVSTDKGEISLQDGEFELRLVPADVENSAPLPGDRGVVVLDTTLTPQLVAEGVARDVVRAVQQARKDADLRITDRISLTLDGDDDVIAAARTHQQFIAAETLADAVGYERLDTADVAVGDGGAVRVAVTIAA